MCAQLEMYSFNSYHPLDVLWLVCEYLSQKAGFNTDRKRWTLPGGANSIIVLIL